MPPMTPLKCRPDVPRAAQLPGVGRMVRSSVGKVLAWRWTSREYGEWLIGGTYHEIVTVMVQFLGITTQPPNMVRPGSSLAKFVGGPTRSNGCHFCAYGKFNR